jgi:hypothetical protein
LQRLAARADALLALTDRLPIRGGPGIRVETGPHGAVISALATAARPQVAMPGGSSPTLGTLFAVVLVQSGGSNGTASAAPTYTYKINDINDEVELEGTPQAPELGRPNGAVTAATRGMAYYDVDGDITLFYAHEVPTTDDCE